jgi:hypothetical protein
MVVEVKELHFGVDGQAQSAGVSEIGLCIGNIPHTSQSGDEIRFMATHKSPEHTSQRHLTLRDGELDPLRCDCRLYEHWVKQRRGFGSQLK